MIKGRFMKLEHLTKFVLVGCLLIAISVPAQGAGLLAIDQADPRHGHNGKDPAGEYSYRYERSSGGHNTYG